MVKRSNILFHATKTLINNQIVQRPDCSWALIELFNTIIKRLHKHIH